MEFDVWELAKAGLRYLAADRDGTMWAFEHKPDRSDNGKWLICLDVYLRLPDGDEGAEIIKYWHEQGRRIVAKVDGAPVRITWEDGPFDLVEKRYLPESWLKTWPYYL